MVICIVLFALGHMIRDGWPATGHTNLGARPLGGLLCCIGGYIALGPIGALLGSAVFVGFWTDQKHAEGQQCRGWRDAAYLAFSGMTSLAPLAIATGVLVNPWLGAIALLGLAKPPIWFACWLVGPDRWLAWAYPTRIASIVFGAAVGGAVALV